MQAIKYRRLLSDDIVGICIKSFIYFIVDTDHTVIR
jgi:hypothetical protein